MRSSPWDDEGDSSEDLDEPIYDKIDSNPIYVELLGATEVFLKSPRANTGSNEKTSGAKSTIPSRSNEAPGSMTSSSVKANRYTDDDWAVLNNPIKSLSTFASKSTEKIHLTSSMSPVVVARASNLHHVQESWKFDDV